MTGHLLVPSLNKNTHYGPRLELSSLTLNKTNIFSESQEDTDKIQMSLKKNHSEQKTLGSGMKTLQGLTYTYARLLVMCQEMRHVSLGL